MNRHEDTECPACPICGQHHDPADTGLENEAPSKDRRPPEDLTDFSIALEQDEELAPIAERLSDLRGAVNDHLEYIDREGENRDAVQRTIDSVKLTSIAHDAYLAEIELTEGIIRHFEARLEDSRGRRNSMRRLMKLAHMLELVATSGGDVDTKQN